MAPVMADKVRLHELLDGTYDIADVALLNDALAVQAENLRRAQAAANRT